MNTNQSTIIDLQKRVAEDSRSALDSILRDGAQRMLQSAIELEVAEYIDEHQNQLDETRLRLVVRNGHQKERRILTGVGALTIKKPRVHDRRQGHYFVSTILPKYLARGERACHEPQTKRCFSWDLGQSSGSRVPSSA